MLIYLEFMKRSAKGQIPLDGTSLQAALVRPATTCGTENTTITTVADFSNLAELSGTGYARKTLANCTLTRDNATLKIIFKCDEVKFGILETDNVSTAGMLVLDPATNVPVAYFPFAGAFSFTAPRAFRVKPSASGLLTIRQG